MHTCIKIICIKVNQMFLDICEIKIEDEVKFSFKKIDKIREGDKIIPKEDILYETLSGTSVHRKVIQISLF